MKALFCLCLLALLAYGAYRVFTPAKAAPDEFADVPAKPGETRYPKPFWGRYVSDRTANLDSIRNCVTLTPKGRKDFSEFIETKWKAIRVTPHSFELESEAYRDVATFTLVSANDKVLIIEAVKANAQRTVRNMARETVTLEPRGLRIEFDFALGLHLHYIRVR